MASNTNFDLGRNADGPMTYRHDRAGRGQPEEEKRRRKLAADIAVLEGTKLARGRGRRSGVLTPAERVLLDRQKGFQRQDEAADRLRELEREQQEAAQQAMQDMESQRRW